MSMPASSTREYTTEGEPYAHAVLEALYLQFGGPSTG